MTASSTKEMKNTSSRVSKFQERLKNPIEWRYSIICYCVINSNRKRNEKLHTLTGCPKSKLEITPSSLETTSSPKIRTPLGNLLPGTMPWSSNFFEMKKKKKTENLNMRSFFWVKKKKNLTVRSKIRNMGTPAK